MIKLVRKCLTRYNLIFMLLGLIIWKINRINQYLWQKTEAEEASELLPATDYEPVSDGRIELNGVSFGGMNFDLSEIMKNGSLSLDDDQFTGGGSRYGAHNPDPISGYRHIN